jgi:hypothetical protein
MRKTDQSNTKMPMQIGMRSEATATASVCSRRCFGIFAGTKLQ